MQHAQLSLIDPELIELALLLTQVAETAEVLEGHEVVPPLLSAAEDALARLDWPTATAAYVSRVAPGREAQRIWQLPPGLDAAPPGLDDGQRAAVSGAADFLRERLRRLRDRYPQSGALALTGHAHIDLAWEWPLEETRRKAVRTFHTMVGLMDRHPELPLQPVDGAALRLPRGGRPGALRAHQGEGGGRPVGADRRDVGRARHRHADRRSRWSASCSTASAISRGPSASAMTSAGCRTASASRRRCRSCCCRRASRSFFTIKVNWSETNKMPFDLFWWEGLDGSRVLAHTFDNPVGGYNAEIGPRAVVETWRNFRGKHLHPESLLAFGYGDGGGGPTEEMLARQRQFADFPVVPALRPVARRRLVRVGPRGGRGRPELPVWVGEMYLELHRGTLTTQGRTKLLNRRAERALITAETLSSMAALLGEPLAGSLEDQWRIVLRNQFHDILPGSSIREVYELAEAELASVVAAGDRISDERLASIAARVVRAGRPVGGARRQPRPLAPAAPARVRRPAAGRPAGRGRQRALRHARRFRASPPRSSSTTSRVPA